MYNIDHINTDGYYDSNGYRYLHLSKNPLIRKRDHPIRAHRLIFEEYYDCCLLKWGHVHHINGIKDDNRIENLEGMSNRQHTKLHMLGHKYGKKDMSNRICFKCSTNKTYVSKHGHEKWFSFGSKCFICRKCYRKLISFIKKFNLNLIGARSIKREK